MSISFYFRRLRRFVGWLVLSSMFEFVAFDVSSVLPVVVAVVDTTPIYITDFPFRMAGANEL